MGRNFLAHSAGDAANAVFAAAGYNFRRLLAWLALFCAIILAALTRLVQHRIDPPLRDCSFFTGD